MTVRKLCLAAFTAWAGFASAAQAQSGGPSLVIDASTGTVLHEERASQAWHPASTTKMMTAYVALRAVRAGRIGLETAIPASKLAASQPRVKVYIKPGQEITLDNALKVMMVKSANDIAYVIAEGVGGTVPNFVEMMNAEARRLGLQDTVFRNPNGWHHPEQQTSARDLAVLAMVMLREFPEYGEYWGIGAVQLGRVTLNNTNGLIGRYSGASGFKTGFVCASGFNVVATAMRGGRTLIAVVLGAYSGAERTVKAAQILDAGFSSWGGGARTVASIPPSGGAASSVCAEVRAYGRGAPLADDVETSGPISFAPTGASSDVDLARAGMTPAPAATAMRMGGGRITLGPREAFAPIVISYGRSAGSASAPLAANVAPKPATAVAQGGRAPQGAPELAGISQPLGQTEPQGRPRAPSANGAIALGGTGAVAAAAAAFASRTAPTGTEGPIRLPGAIGGQAQPAPLRPSAAAGIRPQAPRPATAALAPVQRAAEPARTAGKPNLVKPAAPRTAAPKPAAARAGAPKPAAQSAQATARTAKPPARPIATPPRRPSAPPAE